MNVTVFQMLLCTTGDEVVNEEGETTKKKDKDKKHQYSHGSKQQLWFNHLILKCLKEKIITLPVSPEIRAYSKSFLEILRGLEPR